MKLSKREYLYKNNNVTRENIMISVSKMRYPDKAIKARVDGLWLAITSLFSIEIPIGIPILFSVLCSILFLGVLIVLLAFVIAAFTVFVCSVISVTVATMVISISRFAGISFVVIGVLFFLIGIFVLCVVVRVWKLFFLLTEKIYKNIVLKYML